MLAPGLCYCSEIYKRADKRSCPTVCYLLKITEKGKMEHMGHGETGQSLTPEYSVREPNLLVGDGCTTACIRGLLCDHGESGRPHHLTRLSSLLEEVGSTVADKVSK